MTNFECIANEQDVSNLLGVEIRLAAVCLPEVIAGDQPPCILPGGCDYAPDCANTGYCNASERN